MKRRFAALAAVGMAACAKPEASAASDVVVVVYSDPSLEPELARVAVEVRDDHGDRVSSSHAFTLAGDAPLPLSFGVVQPRGGAEWFMLVTQGLDRDGALLVEHKVIAHFEPRRTGILQVYLASACVGQLCDGDPALTCDGDTGACNEIARVRPSLDGDAGTPSAIDLSGSTAEDAGAEDAAPSSAGRAVPSQATTFSSLGGRRGDGALSVVDDGFDGSERRCTRDGMFCVTGSFGP